jgi:hypothetical protein
MESFPLLSTMHRDDLHELLGITEWERPDQESIDKAENGRRGADRQPESQNDCNRKPGCDRI